MADQIGKLDALVDNGVVKGETAVFCSHRDFAALHEQMEDEGLEYAVVNGAIVAEFGSKVYERISVAATTQVPRGVFVLTATRAS